MPSERLSAADTLQMLVNLGAINPRSAIRLSDVEGLDRDVLDELIRDGRLRHTLFNDQLYYVPIQTLDFYVSPFLRKFSIVMAIVVVVLVTVLQLLRVIRS